MSQAILSIYNIGKTTCNYTALFKNHKGFGFYNITSNGKVFASGMFSRETTSGTVSGLAAGTTYTMLLTCADDVQTYTDTYTFTTISEISRPNYFNWDTPKISGGTFNLTAREWNKLITNINRVRNYKGYSSYTFTIAQRGNQFTALMFNEVVSAINTMKHSYVYSKVRGMAILASDLNALVSTLNSIF